MASFNIVMPKLGESIQEGTITKWFVKEGDTIEEDDVLFEVATDKVDSEIPSPVDGVVSKILYPEDSLVAVGEVLAVISLDGAIDESAAAEVVKEEKITSEETKVTETSHSVEDSRKLSNRFYSPLVKTIAKEENVTLDELEKIQGSGAGGRVQKKDILDYLENRGESQPVQSVAKAPVATSTPATERKAPMTVTPGAGDQVIEMDRIRKLIADHMVMSVQVSPHVTSVVEADVTELVLWRNRNKDAFQKKYGDKITFMPIFTEAVALALSEFPLVNSSV
ncbi:MAG: 2-oxo acid dehydrogenase subunit E2, partial [Bacteroidales bacterium]|nr:2-oxo acid dehydrogenase subunit E2 [Bacteroidales bacterium]